MTDDSAPVAAAIDRLDAGQRRLSDRIAGLTEAVAQDLLMCATHAGTASRGTCSPPGAVWEGGLQAAFRNGFAAG